MKSKLFFLITLSFLLFSGCATNSKFMRLSLGMSKEEAFNTIGKPNTLRASKIDEEGKILEVYEYLALKTNSDWWYSSYTQYWLSFKNGKLAQWGESGDWQVPKIATEEHITIKKEQ